MCNAKAPVGVRGDVSSLTPGEIREPGDRARGTFAVLRVDGDRVDGLSGHTLLMDWPTDLVVRDWPVVLVSAGEADAQGRTLRRWGAPRDVALSALDDQTTHAITRSGAVLPEVVTAGPRHLVVEVLPAPSLGGNGLPIWVRTVPWISTGISYDEVHRDAVHPPPPPAPPAATAAASPAPWEPDTHGLPAGLVAMAQSLVECLAWTQLSTGRTVDEGGVVGPYGSPADAQQPRRALDLLLALLAVLLPRFPITGHAGDGLTDPAPYAFAPTVDHPIAVDLVEPAGLSEVPPYGAWIRFEHARRTWITCYGAIFLASPAASDICSPMPDGKNTTAPFAIVLAGEPCVIDPTDRGTLDGHDFIRIRGGAYDARFIETAVSMWPAATWTAPSAGEAMDCTVLPDRRMAHHAACARVDGAIVAIVAALYQEPSAAPEPAQDLIGEAVEERESLRHIAASRDHELRALDPLLEAVSALVGARNASSGFGALTQLRAVLDASEGVETAYRALMLSRGVELPASTPTVRP
jgi:hypothetical protein